MLTSLVIFIQTVQAADASSLKERPSLRQKCAENRIPQIRKARKRIGMLISNAALNATFLRGRAIPLIAVRFTATPQVV